MKDIIKKLLSNTILLVIIIGGLYILYLRECRRPLECPPPDQVLVSQGFLDSLTMIANQPPDTISVHDTVIITDRVIVSVEIPIPVFIDSTTNFYQDSTISDSIRHFQSIWIKGNNIINWEKAYEPIVFFRETTIEVSNPIPIPYEVPVVQRELFAYGTLGGSQINSAFGVGLLFTTKTRYIYGAEVVRWKETNIWSVKIGGRILPRKGK